MKKIYSILIGLLLSLSAFADIQVPLKTSLEIWTAVDVIGKIENLPLIQNEGRKLYLELDKIECVFEQYEACSFFADIDGVRKLIVSVDGSNALIRSLARAGVLEDRESPRLEARNLKCLRDGEMAACTIVEYPQN